MITSQQIKEMRIDSSPRLGKECHRSRMIILEQATVKICKTGLDWGQVLRGKAKINCLSKTSRHTYLKTSERLWPKEMYPTLHTVKKFNREAVPE